MYCGYRRVQKPTGADQCVAANFTAPHHNNLIVVRSNVIDVFVLVRAGGCGVFGMCVGFA
jgi:hypothetical protein